MIINSTMSVIVIVIAIIGKGAKKIEDMDSLALADASFSQVTLIY